MRLTIVLFAFMMSFCSLADTLIIVRGPYLQLATQTSIIIKWRTNTFADGMVFVGEEISNLNKSFAAKEMKNGDLEAQVTGLKANTQYFYEVLSKNELNQEVKSGKGYFYTLPDKGQTGRYTFLVLGDPGTGKPEQIEAKQAAIKHNSSNHFDGVLILGDNAYPSGTDQNYQDGFFRYDEIFANSVIWPTPGNHEYNNHIPFSKKPAYYDIFNCPTNAEAGGIASGSEKYYSYDFGNIHFISLDSYDVSSKPQKKMAKWLEADLAANSLEWTVVYFHHPPYSKGSHNSDNSTGLDRELVKMRTRIAPILEKHDVDLVLNGHSHSYERSYLIKDHFGKSKTIADSNFVDHNSGSYPTDCPYHKKNSNVSSSNGTVYCVMGCSGKKDHVKKPRKHVVMHKSDFSKVGTLLLTIEGNQLKSDFLTKEGELFDSFTIVKNAGKTEEIIVKDNKLPELSTTWKAMTYWKENGVHFDHLPFRIEKDMILQATDRNNCIQDTFLLKADSKMKND